MLELQIKKKKAGVSYTAKIKKKPWIIKQQPLSLITTKVFRRQTLRVLGHNSLFKTGHFWI